MRRLFLLLALAIPISAHPQTAQPKDGTLTLPDYRSDDAQHLPGLRLHYLTLGTLERDAEGHVTNAVLLMHGTTSHLYLVMPDSIGAGGSSKPSDGLCGRWTGTTASRRRSIRPANGASPQRRCSRS